MIPTPDDWKKWKANAGVKDNLCPGIDIDKAFANYARDGVKGNNAIFADPQKALAPIKALLVPLVKYANALKQKDPGNPLNAQLKTTFATLAKLKAQISAVADPWTGALLALRKLEQRIREVSGRPSSSPEWIKVFQEPLRALKIAVKLNCGRVQAQAKYQFVLERFEHYYEPCHAGRPGGEGAFDAVRWTRDINVLCAVLRGMGDALDLWSDHIESQPVPGLPPQHSKEQWQTMFRQQLKGPPKRALPTPPPEDVAPAYEAPLAPARPSQAGAARPDFLNRPAPKPPMSGARL